MSDDPFLYSNQLQSSTNPPVRWEDVHFMLQKDIFDHFGCVRQVRCRRVCKSWKRLLEDWPCILLADEFLSTKASIAKTSKRSQEVLRKAFKACRMMIIDFSHTENQSKVVESQLGGRTDYIIKGFLSAVDHGGNLKYIIVTGGRMSGGHYFELLGLFGLSRVQRPVQFSLIKCEMAYTTTAFRREKINPFYQLFPDEFGQVAMPNWSIQRPASEVILYRELLMLFHDMLLPYPNAQVEWLADCRETAHDMEQTSEGRDTDVSLYTYIRFCKNYHAFWLDSHLWAGPAYTFKYHSADKVIRSLEMIAIAVSYSARMVFTGKLKLPLPPEPVLLCPVHTKTAICSCSVATKDIQEPSQKKTPT